MPRISNNIKALAEAHYVTMRKSPSFAVWSKRHLKKSSRVDDYEKAFNYLSEKNEATTKPRSSHQDHNVSSLRPLDESDIN